MGDKRRGGDKNVREWMECCVWLVERGQWRGGKDGRGRGLGREGRSAEGGDAGTVR